MATVLVTGATGTLGVPTTARLREAGHEVRALSRSSGPALTTGNLLTGEGIPDAMAGVDTLVHLATGRRDIDQAKAAIDAAREANVAHIVLISIVGVEEIPLGYYKGKVAIESYLTSSGLPYTLLRATQFHQLVDFMFSVQKFSPVLLAPRFSFQPISPDDVAARLAELASGEPRGRVDDIGGPEQLSARALAEQWKAATSSRRAIGNLRLPGKTVAAYAAGHNLVPGAPYGVTTFQQYLRARYSGRQRAVSQ